MSDFQVTPPIASTLSQNQVLVSIIIVVLQHRDELCGILDSILKHSSPETEIIVIDGGSTDGTVETLKALDSRIAHWVSEPDKGIYDAMNKGIAAARGIYIYHINAGDRLLCLPINELRDADAHGIDVVSFSVSVDNSKVFRPSCGWRLRITNTLHHQGTFYRRANFPGYDLRFKVFADFDVNQRLLLQQVKFRLSETIVANHSNSGVSSHKLHRTEIFRVIASNFGIVYVPLAWSRARYAGIKIRVARLLAGLGKARISSLRH
jgi:glycosyltransferase involved in cell wall biosynthesis